MKKIKIAVGTTSEQKLKYLKEVLKGLKVKAELFTVAAKSGVPEQPKTSEETEKGAINRAIGAANEIKNEDFSIGIEVGYHQEKQGYEMFCWVAIMDKTGYQISSQSHKFLLPKYFQNLLQEDIYLGDNLDGYLQKSKDRKHKKYVDDIVRNRKSFIENALRNALIRYLNKEDF
jgi:non-canonical (house-cleaning) NTP pyrophosphatase